MLLTPIQTIIMIFAIAAGVMITRFLPFVLFPDKKEAPAYITYLGKVLPPAMMGLLVVYCFKSVSITSAPFGIPEALAAIVVIGLHSWKNNALFSIGGGTVVYMYLLQVIFR
jgi:branched-subunit amino acid transport protein AzlD